MIVILNKDVKGTGKAGDVVKVSDGYARNMLIPRGMATEATEGNISVRSGKEGELGVFDVDDFIAKLREEIDTKAI